MTSEIVEQVERLSREVRIEGDYLIFEEGGPYEIALSEIDTPEKALMWLRHLSEKTWFTTDIARTVIEVLGERFAWSIW